MDVRIARVHAPVTVLGPGRRVGVWFQGCTIGCAGCMSMDTWDADAGHVMTVAALTDIVVAAADEHGLNGLTVSGGEPFQQPTALRRLVLDVRRRWPGVDVLAYSGYPMRFLERHHGAILADLDAVISEPFRSDAPTDAPWRGSANQRLVVMSTRARDVYDDVDGRPSRLQVGVDEGGLHVLGIPHRGDLQRLQARLAERGVLFDDVSWAP